MSDQGRSGRGDKIKALANSISADFVKSARGQAVSRPQGSPVSLFRSWAEIRLRVRAAKRLAIFLDFDGTLVGLRRRPGDVRVPKRLKRILASLARHANVSIAIVSGRRLRDLQSLIGIESVRYFGLHGAEQEGKRPALTKETRLALGRAKREARMQLGVLPGVWLEDKVCSLAIHYRGASAAFVREAYEKLLRLLALLHHELSVIPGEKVWEILPREFAGKGTTVLELLTEMPRGTLAVYAGDDTSDETAFATLTDQITIQVGRRPGSRAQFRLRNPTELLRFLARMERELP